MLEADSCRAAACRMTPPTMTAFPRLACLLLLTLAACDQGPATVTPYKHPSGTLDFLTAATRNGGPLYLEIDGDPFGSGEDLESLVTGTMEPALQTRMLRLTTDQEAAEDPDFRLVVVFNPQGGDHLMAFCESQPEGAPPVSAERIELRAGFCRGDDLLGAVDGWVEEAEGPDDPRFAQLMQQVVRDLFTRRQPD